MSTAIEWTDETWNPVTGCSKVSQGCKHCYAERIFKRPYPGREFTDVRTHPDRLDQPLHWKKPRRIFVNSMSDLFHEDVPFEFIDKVFAVMALATQHTFQVLTKRPGRMNAWFEKITRREVAFVGGVKEYARGQEVGMLLRTFDDLWDSKKDRDRQSSLGWRMQFNRENWPLPNVQLGVSCEDQPTADERIPELLRTPAAVRFVSLEPLLGPIDLGDSLSDWPRENTLEQIRYGTPKLDWIIVGGESGPHARPCHPDWIRSLRDQCVAAGVPFFFRQWGEWVSVSEVAGPGAHHHFPDGSTVRRTGKKIAGAMLDGKEWREFPKTSSEGIRRS